MGLKQVNRMLEVAKRKSAPKHLGEDYSALNPIQNRKYQKSLKHKGRQSFLPGQIRAPSRGDFIKRVEQEHIPVGATFTPAQRQLSEALVKGHEVSETQVRRPLMYFETQTRAHANPSVIFREHNAVRQVDPSIDPNSAVRQTFKNMRKEVEDRSIQGLFPSFDYGESPRLSRHAIRRMSDALESRGHFARQAANRNEFSRWLGNPVRDDIISDMKRMSPQERSAFYRRGEVPDRIRNLDDYIYDMEDEGLIPFK